MIPEGFVFSTAEAAVKKPGRDDIALIFSEVEAAIAGTFTTNRIKAAPVKLNLQNIRSGRGRAIVVNSGNANACTGVQGLRDAEETVSLLAKHLGVDEKSIYVCSTGVIGVPLPMKRMRPAIKQLAAARGNAKLKDVAKAIMTTDKFPKYLSRKLKIGTKEGKIAAVCKGAGMIEPNMATMLCFIMTDIAVEQKTLKNCLKDAVDGSFNRITVDGNRSTNDSVLLMANGSLGNPVITHGTRNYEKLKRAISEITYGLARMIVKDGEGATKLVEVMVKGARTEAEARKGAFAVANSVLVKTAMYGNDPNWGRIMAILGSCGITVDENKTDIFLGDVKVVSKGVTTNRDRQARKAVSKQEFEIVVNLNLGNKNSSVLTCDLTEEYVRFNAQYTT